MGTDFSLTIIWYCLTTAILGTWTLFFMVLAHVMVWMKNVLHYLRHLYIWSVGGTVCVGLRCMAMLRKGVGFGGGGSRFWEFKPWGLLQFTFSVSCFVVQEANPQIPALAAVPAACYHTSLPWLFFGGGDKIH